MALTMAIAAAFLATGLWIVLEIQAKTTNPDAKPATTVSVTLVTCPKRTY
jgi:hypothetical protein